jgi:very-short-patch-repair endonuclease
LKQIFKDVLTIQTQFRLEQYYFDLLLEEYKIFIEYDESQHSNKMQHQKDSEKDMCAILNQYFVIRIKQGEEIQGLNTILKFLLGTKQGREEFAAHRNHNPDEHIGDKIARIMLGLTQDKTKRS